jgi:hypothetical protein
MILRLSLGAYPANWIENQSLDPIRQ